MSAVYATLSSVQLLNDEWLHKFTSAARCRVSGDDLHPLASSALENWFHGLIQDFELIRFVSLVNSENLDWALCLVQG